LGHPALPGHLYNKDNHPYPGFLDLYHKEFGGTGESEFQDGQAILVHDAVWTAGVAIRNTAGADGNGATNAGSELQMLPQLNDGEAVAGISGPISLGADGYPEDKPMALVRLRAGPAIHLRVDHQAVAALRLGPVGYCCCVQPGGIWPG
jgi:hypothetical protein